MSKRGQPILRAENLTKYYESGGSFVDNLLGRTQLVKAVDGVDLELYPGETLGVVGESGCGKTTLGRAILQLLEPTEGDVYYHPAAASGISAQDQTGDINLTEVSSSRLRSLRTDLQYIFQDPFSSLNPRLTVGDIIGEPLDIHNIASGEKRTARIQELLETVGLNSSHAYRYPHEFSGGQRQRIGIARALAVDPEVIVCDEPVSALDVSVQAQILNLLNDLQDEFDLSYIFIAHDLSVVEHISDRVSVMYLGEIAESGPTEEVFTAPKHPYTEALLSVVPEPDPRWQGEKILLEGEVPSPLDPPSGCRFHTRCHRIIQPDQFEIDQSAWRSMFTLKLAIEDAESAKDVLAATAGGEAKVAEMESINIEEGVLRSAYGIPDSLSDPEAERSLSNALDALRVDGPEAARDIFDDVFASPCETTNPDRVETTGAHEVACLLYDDEYPGRVRVTDTREGRDDATADD